jgi:ABC-2 type transport system ATP-binding protein
VIAEHQLVVSELAPVGSSLEEIFFELTDSGTGGPS